MNKLCVIFLQVLWSVNGFNDTNFLRNEFGSGVKEINLLRDGLFQMARPLRISSIGGVTRQCRLDTKLFEKDLNNLEIWALKMYDASGKTPSGLMNGNVHIIGDFDMCVNILRPTKPKISGKYCQTAIFVEPTLHASSSIPKILDFLHSYGDVNSKFDDDINFFPSFTKITWGLCIPSSCSKSDLQKFLNHLTIPYNQTTGLTIKSRVEDCDTQNTNTIKTVFLKRHIFPGFLILSSLLTLSLLGTINDFFNFFGNSFLQAFSLTRNYSKLVQVGPDEDEISCVHGIRFIFSVMIYLSHRSIFGMFQPFSNRTELTETIEGESSMIFRSFWNHVDSFVIMSGLLTAYYGVKKLQSGGKLNPWSMYFKRYIKFAPIFLIVIHAIHVLMELQRGPSMLRVMNHFAYSCRPSQLWKSLLFISNIDGINEMCYPPAHQLLTDFQMYLAAPFVLTFLYSRAKQHAMKVLFGLVAVLSAYKAWVIYSNQLGTVLYFGLSLQEMLKGANLIYLNPIHRATPYLCGLGLGYYLRVWKKIKLSIDQQNIGWCLAIFCGYYSFFALSEASYRTYKSNFTKELLYGVAQPLTWSFTLCWTIFICSSGQAETLNRLLSHRYFHIFSRISYPFYMCQIFIIFRGIGSVNTPIYARMTDMVDLNELTLVLTSSVMLTLVVTYPILNVLNILQGKSNKEVTDLNRQKIGNNGYKKEVSFKLS